MIRITRKVFTDLAIFMMSFGVVIGVIFPLFMLIIGIPREYVITPMFLTACMLAGGIVGAVNILLARMIVGRRLRLLADKMSYIDGKLASGLTPEELAECTQEHCMLTVDSEDEIGESSKAFNDLVHTLTVSKSNEHAVKEFNEMLSSQLELEQLAMNALRQITGFMGAAAGAILFEQGGDLHLAASLNIKDSDRLVDHDSVLSVLSMRKGIVETIHQQIVIESSLVEFVPVETRIDPLLYKGLPVGIIIIAASQVMNAENDYGYELFLRGLSMALRNALMYEQLQKLAANDPLTGLYNRRFGLLRLTEEFSRSLRSGIPLGVIMFDIDHFKAVNDTYGHPVGDKILVNIARVTRMAIREGDFVIRYGGEEFLVILPGSSLEDTQFVAERLRHMIEDSIVKHNMQDLRVTISAGCTSYPENDTNEEMVLIKDADEALYTAKEGGRNRVVLFKR